MWRYMCMLEWGMRKQWEILSSQNQSGRGVSWVETSTPGGLSNCKSLTSSHNTYIVLISGPDNKRPNAVYMQYFLYNGQCHEKQDFNVHAWNIWPETENILSMNEALDAYYLFFRCLSKQLILFCMEQRLTLQRMIRQKIIMTMVCCT